MSGFRNLYGKPLILKLLTQLEGSARAAAYFAILAAAAFMLVPGVMWAAQAVAMVEVNAQELGAQIPKDFLGFSNEVSVAGQGLPTPTAEALGENSASAGVPAGARLVYVLGQPGAPNTDFFQFMRNLGPGVLRLGGNSQDNTCWDPQTAPHPDWCGGPITSGDLKLYSTAVGAAGWHMILGLNLKQNAPSWVLSEATQGVTRQIPDSQILGLEIGNEPSLFAGGAARPKTYSPQDYVQDALGYIHAFRANPVARKYAFVAPANCCSWNNPHDLGIILQGIGTELKLVSTHNYTTTTCGQRNVTATELLSPERMERFNALSKELVAAAHGQGLPMALAETNSASCGGMAGVSNAFASAVWGLDYMFNVAQDGYTNIDFHFSYRHGGSAYNPIQTFGWQTNAPQYWNIAQPLYYAMYLFARYASGEHFLAVSLQTRSNISAIATTSCADCEVHVFVINKDETASGEVRVQLSGDRGRASLLLLLAPSIHSLAADVRYGGHQFDTHGHILGADTTSVPRGAHNDYVLELPNASAAVLSIPPKV
jgi:hypothetical protein